MFAPPVAQWLSGNRLHLSQGPIDVVIKAWGPVVNLQAAYAAASERFPTILAELCDELSCLRSPISEAPRVSGPVARRMVCAALPFVGVFVTPMAAVAGAVADELLACMLKAAPLYKAFVNDGGDIAVTITGDNVLDVGVAGDFTLGDAPAISGALSLDGSSGVGGIATSGARGRSFSLGVADAVTVLARDAATADVAATLIANAVNVDSASVRRRPARDLDPDSDLGDRLVTMSVGALTPCEIRHALDNGLACAASLRSRGLIVDAALMLAGHSSALGYRTPAAARAGRRSRRGDADLLQEFAQ
jgi:uncharacterized protein